MKRIIAILGLLLIIIASASFVYLKSAALESEQNYFNQHLRSRFASLSFLRHILDLHYDGDARADYLEKHYQRILLEVDVMDSLEMSLEAIDLLRDRIHNITGKPVAYIVSDTHIPYERELTSENLKKIVSGYRTYQSNGDTATIYLLYASRWHDKTSFLGMTYQEYGIVLFGDELQSFTRENSSLLPKYEASTALHEFGHQLGLPHNTEPNCLMNEQADEAQVVVENSADVLTDFCDFEKQMIRNKILD